MNTQILFLLFFVAAPLTELYFLIEIGSEIGAFTTIVLSVFTAVLGGLLVRIQGLAVFFRMQKSLAVGDAPALEMLEAVALLISGFALLLPGFITDTLGFLLLITPFRQFIVRRFFKPVPHQKPPGHEKRPNNDPSRIIEGEFRRDDES